VTHAAGRLACLAAFAALVPAALAADRFAFSAKDAPQYEAWMTKELRPVAEKWLVEATRLIDGPEGVAPTGVRISLYPETGKEDAPAWTAGNEIALNMKWAKDELDGEAKGAVVHEIVHAVQRYPKAPGWVTEGIADWVRWLHYEGTAGEARCRRDAQRNPRHDAGYGVSACFLEWVRMAYDKDLVVKLNGLCRKGAYADSFWKEETGRTLSELAAAWKTSLKDEARPLTVATYNIRRAGDKGDNDWTNRLPRIVHVVWRRGVELMGLQEAFPNQIADLRRELKGWSSVGCGRSAKRKDEASPIFWKESVLELLDSGTFWLSDTPEKPGTSFKGAMFPRICTWARFRVRATGAEFYHFNTHLDHKAPEPRRKSAKLILRRMDEIAKGAPAFLTGDLNDEIGTSAYLAEVKAKDRTVLSPDDARHPIRILGTKLCDARKVCATPPRGTEWTDNGYGVKHVKRIDYLFATKDVRVVSYEVCDDRPNGKYPSDHEPLVVGIRLPDAKGKARPR